MTVSALGIVNDPSSPNSAALTLRKSSIDDSIRHSTTTTLASPVANSPSFDTIIEGEEMEAPIMTRGNSSSYKDSPMAKLIAPYCGEEDSDELSTEAWVNILVTKDDLEPELVERMEDLNKGTTKYKLSNEFLEGLIRILTELQVLVEKAASLIEEWT